MTPARILGTFVSLPDLLPADAEILGAPPQNPVSNDFPMAKVAYVHPVGSTFEFDQHHPRPKPVRILAFLAYSRLGEPKDIVGWNPETDRARSWLGYAWAWGEESILRPRLGPDAIPIWRSPRNRLKAGLNGLVVLRPIALLHHVLGLPTLCAEDACHRAELKRHLEAALPRIVITQEVFP